jgi:hypothetical protein
VNCRRCSECAGETHHWIENLDFSGGEIEDANEFVCKHCDAVAFVCPECDEVVAAADTPCASCAAPGGKP